MFFGSIQFNPWERIWKSWAPSKCKFFIWLAAHDRCWTADRLAKKGLPHPAKCPLCDQEKETINHLLLTCVFSRQAWFFILQRVGLQSLAPQLGDLSFDDWWDQSSKRVEGQNRKSLNSLIILVAWSLWNHRNGCVFDGRQPSLNDLLSAIKE
jgi:hypothetical protein